VADLIAIAVVTVFFPRLVIVDFVPSWRLCFLEISGFRG